MHWIPVLLVLLLYMFQAAFLPIIRSSKLYIGFGTFYAVVTVCCQESDGTGCIRFQFHPLLVLFTRNLSSILITLGCSSDASSPLCSQFYHKSYWLKQKSINKSWHRICCILQAVAHRGLEINLLRYSNSHQRNYNMQESRTYKAYFLVAYISNPRCLTITTAVSFYFCEELN
jgi:hypothetical protein